MSEIKQPSALEIIIVSEIKGIMSQCDDDPERDFLQEFGQYRQQIVYQQKVTTVDRFDELCQIVLNDLEKKDTENDEKN